MLDIICIFTVLNQNSQSAAKLPIMQIKQIKNFPDYIIGKKFIDYSKRKYNQVIGKAVSKRNLVMI